MSNKSLGDRMKEYESVSDISLTKRTPVIIRLDGKAFHTLTQGLDRPFDEEFHNIMVRVSKFLCENIQGVEFAYTQSDEISLLLTDYETIRTEAWFDYRIQKLCSVSAGYATVKFNEILDILKNNEAVEFIHEEVSNKFRDIKRGVFDSRVFNLPKNEVCNYFIWRQKDSTRNSIQSVGQYYFSHNEMQGLSNNEVQEKLWQEEDVNWNDLDVWKKRGVCIKKVNERCCESDMFVMRDGMRTIWIEDGEIPIFTEDRNYINQYVFKEN